MTDARLLPTPQGDARVLVRSAQKPRATLLLQPGAGGGIGARELVALSTGLPSDGITTLVLQHPFSVAGKRMAPRPAVLDESLTSVVRELRRDLLEGEPLVLGGRSAGARSSARMARPLGAVACLALAFPLHPPGKPERSRLEELLGVGVPTLVVQGGRDVFGRPDEFPSRLPEGIRMSVLPDADHGFAVPRSAVPDQAASLEWLVEEVRSWLRDHVVGNGGRGPGV
ncbi:MAG: hydrolase [Actinomycetota bacterium]|nr:hydrolase [Actinomycetota bacterium]